ncbi:hypothetical protein nbrc107697_04930 [Gordonia crocea]|uniref:Translation initiation factor IF-2 N-terminal domain-containing protein n=1 Tax=Gordonia crocea TaxID=589162 RepID=A0A7M3SUY0_9ACTN|nr:hypothetical protein nbrc107697_04930 [Gordonia crocea]
MAGKARVYELAVEIGVSAETVLERLREQGEYVKSKESTVEAAVARRLRASFAPAPAPKRAVVADAVPKTGVVWSCTPTAGRQVRGRLSRAETTQEAGTARLEIAGDFAARKLVWDRYPDQRRTYSDQNGTSTITWSGRVPREAEALAASLCDLVTVGPGGRDDPNLVCRFALDWYTAPDDDRPSEEWERTETGGLVYRLKYGDHGPGERAEARTELARRLAAAITANPLLAQAKSVIAVPGHRADGSSQGEMVAREVAAMLTGVGLVTVTSSPRPERKADTTVDLADTMSIPGRIDGPCVIVDDVVRSGQTFTEVARAARAAGASEVYAIAGAKTLRS